MSKKTASIFSRQTSRTIAGLDKTLASATPLMLAGLLSVGLSACGFGGGESEGSSAAAAGETAVVATASAIEAPVSIAATASSPAPVSNAAASETAATQVTQAAAAPTISTSTTDAAKIAPTTTATSASAAASSAAPAAAAAAATINSIDTIVNDMKLRNDFTLKGYEGYSSGWYVGPGYTMMGNVANTSNTPSLLENVQRWKLPACRKSGATVDRAVRRHSE